MQESGSEEFRGRINAELSKVGWQHNGEKVDYMVQKVQPVMSAMVRGVLSTRPEDVALFFLGWLLQYCEVPSDTAEDVRSWIHDKQPSEFTQSRGSVSEPVGRISVGDRVSMISDDGGGDWEDPNDDGEGEEHVDETASDVTGKSAFKKEKSDSNPERKTMKRASFWQAPPPGEGEDDEKDANEGEECPWAMRSQKKRASEELKKKHQGRQRRFTVNLKFVAMPSRPEEEVLELIKPIPALQHLSEEQLKKLVPHFETKCFESEEDVVTYGQPQDFLHVVCEGKGRICIPQQTNTVEKGHYFGEEALKQVGSPWNKTVTAMGKITTISIKGDVFEELGLQMSKISKNKKVAINKTGAKALEDEPDEDEGSKSRCKVSGGLKIIRKDDRTKTAEEQQIIRTAVRANKALTDVLQLSDEQLDYLIDSMYLIGVPGGVAITKIGESGDACYVINHGVFQVSLGEQHHADSDDHVPIRLRLGDSFGELALLYDSPRAATITAAEDSEVWVLTRAAFKIIMRMSYTQRLAQYHALISNVEVFDALDAQNKDMLADALEEVHFLIDEEIVTQGESADGFFVIFDGECEVLKDQEIVGQMKKGSYFGERALRNEKQSGVYDMTVRATSETVTLLFLDKLTFGVILKAVDDMNRKLLAKSLEERTDLTVMSMPAKPGAGFDPSTAAKARRFSAGMEQKSGAAPETAKYMDHLDKQKHLHDVFTERRTSLLNHQLEESKGVKNFAPELQGSGKGPSLSDGDNPNLDEMEVIGKLGEGSFGYVLLVKDKAHDRYIGLKAMNKERIQNEGLQEMIKNERSCQLSINSKFVVRLYGTYQTEEHVFMALEPCLGGELFDVYNEKNFFKSQDHAKFYISCCSLALEAIHAKRVIYRDLKMENCLLTNTGYCKLTDMGLAKMILGKTYTVCGTADYFAPETLKQTGHNRAVDWWAIGVLLFIFMAGRSPFDAEDVLQIYKNIVKGFSKVKFPKNFVPDLVDAIKSLCRKKPEERITMQKGGVQNLKDHPFFIGFDWNELAEETMVPPYIPDTPSDDEIRARPRSDAMDNLDLQDWDGSFEEAPKDMVPPSRTSCVVKEHARTSVYSKASD